MARVVFLLMTIALGYQVSGQAIPYTFNYQKSLDMRWMCQKPLTPGFLAQYNAFAVSYSRNFVLHQEDEDDLIIGFNLDPSFNYTWWVNDQAQSAFIPLSEGRVSFTPSLFLRVHPEANSPFEFFVSASAGVKFFPKLDGLDSTKVISDGEFDSTDDDNGLYDQWIFQMGAGISYRDDFQIGFNYTRSWFDVTSSTEDYFTKYINSQGTFLRYWEIYFNAHHIFHEKVYAFGSWKGYQGGVFNSESMMSAGVGIRIGWSQIRPKRTKASLRG